MMQTNISGNSAKIDISKLSTGSFILKLDDGYETSTKKFIKN